MAGTPKEDGPGTQYSSLVAAYIVNNYTGRGIYVRREVDLGMSVIGKRRRVDLLLVEETTAKGVVIECKFQGGGGTADEKIPYAIEDLRALPIPGILVYGGPGFSTGVIHMLQACDIAVYCLPNPDDLSPIGPTRRHNTDTFSTWELDHRLGMEFGWWDLFDKGSPRLEASDFRASEWPAIRDLDLTAHRKPPQRVDRPVASARQRKRSKS